MLCNSIGWVIFILKIGQLHTWHEEILMHDRHTDTNHEQ